MSLLLGFAAFVANKAYQSLKTDEKLKHLSPEEYDRQYQDYLSSADLKLGLQSTDNFKNFTLTRVSSLDKLAAMKADADKSDADKKQDFLLKTPDGKSIAEKLEANSKITGEEGVPVANAVKAMKQAFADALIYTDATEKAQDIFNKDIKEVNALIKKSPVFNTAAIASFLKELGNNAQEKIKTQQQAEIKKIKALFRIPGERDLFEDDPDQKKDEEEIDVTPNPELENIKLALGFDLHDRNNTDLKKFAKDTIAALEKSHKETLEKFEQSIIDESNHLHQIAQKERERIGYLATMYDLSPTMKKQIDELYAKNQAKDKDKEQAVIQFENGPDKKPRAMLKGIKVEDLKQIETMTGRMIQKDEDSGEYRMTLPALGLLYYHGLSDNVAYDFLGMAATIRACGYKTITMTMNYPKDPEYSMVLARKQYEACLKAGFDPKDITIKVMLPKRNEKTGREEGNEWQIKSATELFGGDTQRLKMIHEAHAKDQAKRAGYRDQTPSEGPSIQAQTNRLRQAVQAKRGVVTEPVKKKELEEEHNEQLGTNLPGTSQN